MQQFGKGTNVQLDGYAGRNGIEGSPKHEIAWRARHTYKHHSDAEGERHACQVTPQRYATDPQKGKSKTQLNSDIFD